MSQSSWQSDGGFAGCCFNKVVKLLCWMTSVLCSSTNEIWTQNLNPHNLIQALWLHHKPCLQHLGHVDYQITGFCISTLFYSIEREMMKKHALPTRSPRKNMFSRRNTKRFDSQGICFKIRNMYNMYKYELQVRNKLFLVSAQSKSSNLHPSVFKMLIYGSWGLFCFL